MRCLTEDGWIRWDASLLPAVSLFGRGAPRWCCCCLVFCCGLSRRRRMTPVSHVACITKATNATHSSQPLCSSGCHVARTVSAASQSQVVRDTATVNRQDPNIVEETRPAVAATHAPSGAFVQQQSASARAPVAAASNLGSTATTGNGSWLPGGETQLVSAELHREAGLLDGGGLGEGTSLGQVSDTLLREMATNEQLQREEPDAVSEKREDQASTGIVSAGTQLPPAVTHSIEHVAKRTATDLVGVDMGVPDGVEIIDWAAAVEQCSGDAMFLEELLVDLWNESSAHVKKLREVVPAGGMRDSQHEAHSIKGAAANLMCHRLRTAALYIEKGGYAGTKLSQGGPEWNTVKSAMQAGLGILEEELTLFEGLLKEKQLL